MPDAASAVGARAPAAPDALEVADAVAERLLARARAAGVALRSAVSAADREAVFRLRGEVVLERGWASPPELPDGLEHDEYDAAAIQVMGLRDGRLVATSRIVFPRPGRLLPMEAHFGLRVEPIGRVVEAGRGIVRGEHGDLGHVVFGGLLAMTWIEARRHGYEYVCGPARRPLIRVFERLGYRVSILGPARRHAGEDRYPLRFDIPESSDQLRRWLAERGANG